MFILFHHTSPVIHVPSHISHLQPTILLSQCITLSMGSLKNHILIAMPHLQDPYFGRSVVFIAEHTEEGAMGLIVNKPFEDPELKQLFTDVFEDKQSLLKVVPKVYFGGPVMIERGILLHSGNYNTEGTLSVTQDFGITSHKSILEDIADDKGPKQFKLMLGHAGWTSGQLEKEIEDGDWLLQETTIDFIFKTPSQAMWRLATGSFGVDVASTEGLGGLA